jgi:hypothetical protein
MAWSQVEYQAQPIIHNGRHVMRDFAGRPPGVEGPLDNFQ